MDASRPKLKISCYTCDQKLDVSDLEPFVRIRCPGCGTGLQVPLPFGNLLLQEDIGSGELTTVYRAVDITLDRQVVVKVLHPRFMNEPGTAQRFVREARAASAVSHPNIIPIYSCGEMEGKPYIVMQYMEGGSFRKRISSKDTRVSIEEICRWFLDVVRGLEAASLHGILHHDIAPSNLFHDGDGNAKVGDFGLSHTVLGGAPVANEQGELLGELSMRRARFLSPERILTGKEGIPGDFFSLGTTMYEVLTDRPPFIGESIQATIRSRFEHTPRPPRECRGDVPENLNDLILRCLAVAPDERPRSYGEISGVLESIVAPKARTATPTPRVEDRAPARATAKPMTKAKRRIVINGGGNGAGQAADDDDGFPPAPLPPAPAPVVYTRPAAWGPRIFLLLIIALVIGAVYAHITRPAWYVDNVIPLFNPTAGL